MRYVADDGTMFDTEQECKEYEDKQNEILTWFTLYDAELFEVTVKDICCTEYLYVKSHPYEVAEYVYQNSGFERDGIDSKGLYVLNDEGYWQKLDDLITQHSEAIKELSYVRDAILHGGV